MNPLVLALALTLAISVAGNALLGWQWLGARDAATIAAEQRDQAQTAAGMCSKGVEDMRARAIMGEKLAGLARAAAAQRAAARDSRADQILARPAAVPGDACASARVDVDDWLKGRGQ